MKTLMLLLFCTCGFAYGDYFNDLKSARVESNPHVQWQAFGPGMSGYIDKFWIHDTDPSGLRF